MIRPVSEIEYPPSDTQRMKAAMIARMEALSKSSNEFMTVIAARVGAEEQRQVEEMRQLSLEQEQMVQHMQHLMWEKEQK